MGVSLQAGLSTPIFFAKGKKEFPLLSLTLHGLSRHLRLRNKIQKEPIISYLTKKSKTESIG